jgi:general stress protein 26
MRDSQAATDNGGKNWRLIKAAHAALLVTVGPNGELNWRPTGCLQGEFDDTLWFVTFRHSLKVEEIGRDSRVLVAYAKPSHCEYVSLFGTAKLVDDRARLRKLWSEGLRVWFPDGPDDRELALLAVKTDEAKYWTKTASPVSYAWTYVKAALPGKRPSPGEVGMRRRFVCSASAQRIFNDIDFDEMIARMIVTTLRFPPSHLAASGS